ncbi:hypothetical protein HK405_006731, partial [Cladochytrium tenue]
MSSSSAAGAGGKAAAADATATIELADLGPGSSSSSSSDHRLSSGGRQSTSASRLPLCAACGRPALFMCSVCDPATPAQYCSAECQARDWPAHRKTCTGIKPPSASAASAESVTEPQPARPVAAASAPTPADDDAGS